MFRVFPQDHFGQHLAVSQIWSTWLRPLPPAPCWSLVAGDRWLVAGGSCLQILQSWRLCLATFGCLQGHFGSLLAYSGCLSGHSGEHWGALGFLGRVFGAPWIHFGGIWDRFRALLDLNIARSGPERHIADIPESDENSIVLVGFQGWRLLGCSSCVSGVQPGWLGWLAGLCWLASAGLVAGLVALELWLVALGLWLLALGLYNGESVSIYMCVYIYIYIYI